MATKREVALGALVKKYRGTMTQAAVAALLSRELGENITQNQVSDHENGRRWSNPDLPGAYVRVLDIPQDEMVEAAMGFPRASEPQPRTFRQIVEADDTLSKAAKEHLLNQYGLLQMATQHERAGDPVLDKAQ